MADNSKIKNAVKAIIWRSDSSGQPEFLLLKLNAPEAAEKPGGEEWHPAGGAKDFAESDHKALLREAKEEAGIAKSELQIEDEPFFTSEWDAPYEGVPGFHFVAKFYLCRYLGPERQFQLSREHDEAAWFGPNNLPKFLPPQGQAAIAAAVKKVTKP